MVVSSTGLNEALPTSLILDLWTRKCLQNSTKLAELVYPILS